MLLADWLKKKGVARKDFAQSIGVSPSYITALCDGEGWPGRDLANKIAEVTDNAVTANDFVARQPSDSERGAA